MNMTNIWLITEYDYILWKPMDDKADNTTQTSPLLSVIGTKQV